METVTTRFRDPRLTDAFWMKATEGPHTGCWVWDKDQRRLSRTGTPMHGAKVAWRFAYERLIEPLLKGATGKRVCDEVLCVNPAHRVVKQPAECPTCHQTMPAPTTRTESMKFADGRVAVGRKSIDENGDEKPPPPPDVLPVLRDGPRTVDREGRPARKKRSPNYVERYRRSQLPKAPDIPRKLTREESLVGLNIQVNPMPLGDPTGRWERSGDTKKVEFAGGRIREWEELTDEQHSAFNRIRGKQKLEPGTFGRETEAAFDSSAD